MILKTRIPEDFYKLFRTRNMDSYMTCLVALYEENNRLLTSFGLTEEEGCAVIEEEMAKQHILWQIDDQEEEEVPEMIISARVVLGRLIKWGWIRSNYDERLNENILSFPEYSQLYIELFERLILEDENQERQSILSIYSALYTYASDKDKNKYILSNALLNSRNLGMMLSNMQDGMRLYFDELSKSRDFLEIQKVLISEINNSDSQKYAILTTTDSFYRYKESVKELIVRILRQIEDQKEKLLLLQKQYDKETMFYQHAAVKISECDRASQLVYRIEREFDQIEEKYNRLIEQKTIFAKRALARINFILQEGVQNEDSTLRLIGRLNTAGEREAEFILENIQEKIRFSRPYRLMNDNSFYKVRQEREDEFLSLLQQGSSGAEEELEDFVPRPLYTRQELEEFKNMNLQNGNFVTTRDTVKSAEDLEKLLFLWQEATEVQSEKDRIELGREIRSRSEISDNEFAFTELVIKNRRG